MVNVACMIVVRVTTRGIVVFSLGLGSGSHLMIIDKHLIDSELYEYLQTVTGLHFYDDEDKNFEEFMYIYEKRRKG